ncbi:membrane protein involved in aromatic hydrocarbon degradation [Chlorobium limicola DSM 245]|uniref:Membrane protein involved in aromatic hydrocarbon degradation n=2 Tax=Chlorobium limicola TaxID=1092 RepID=B3EDR0_CHLL2|nr:outer membrane protein transport protein [Chlorobium limicola]ACD89140.1 membrane protein involved in aromatic hydrocarbon degradation [Chlorobium limicola DSM 245]
MAFLAVLSAASTAFATNGMNLEGYGAKSHALGGTSTAYDTGNSGVTNNPATLGLREEGSSEIGIGIRGLHPDVNLGFNGVTTTESKGDSYYMPSLSYMRKDGKITWGFAVLAQGGMGTEYGENSSLFSYGMPMSKQGMVPLSGQDIRSEVGVGRLMFPVAYNLTENTVIGASLDFLWASMDLRMDMDGAHFGDMAMQGIGGKVSGSMFGTLGGMIGSSVRDIDYVRYDFSNDNAFLGEAIGYGTGFKVGITHRFGKFLTVGGSYHSQTRISDLETSKAVLSFAGKDAMNNSFTRSVNGTIKVRDFEWPATFAAGVALYPSERWMITADIKHIDWSSVMEKFSTSFTADNSLSNGPFAGQTLDVEMLQNWKDQTVISVGVQYRATDRLALRTGASFASNPVPDMYLNPMFPAITENHYTAGFGYRLSDRSSVSAALAWAPEVSETSDEGLEIGHSQLNWSLNYSHEL